jgi:hypothetical protein
MDIGLCPFLADRSFRLGQVGFNSVSIETMDCGFDSFRRQNKIS